MGIYVDADDHLCRYMYKPGTTKRKEERDGALSCWEND